MSRMLPPIEDSGEYQPIYQSEVAWAGTTFADESHLSERHVHDYWEFVYVASGSGQIMVEQEHFLAQPGDLFIYPPGVEHMEESSPGKKLTMHVLSVINTSDLQFMEFWPIGELEYIRISGTWLNTSFAHLIKQIIQELNKKETAYRVRVQALSFQFQSYLMKYAEQKYANKVINNAYQHINRARKFIQANYHLDISLADIAASTFISVHYLSRLFKRYTGFSPMNYLLLLRIRTAQKLLRETELSVSEVCLKTGYQDLQYFSSLFKRKTGYSPREYRKLGQKKSEE